MSYALGSIGLQLKAFSDYIDFESPHPELRTMFGGALVFGHGGFGKDMSDLYDLMIRIKEDCSELIVDNIRKVASHFENHNLIKNVIDSPLKNLQNVRFVADPQVRKNIRSQKRFQSIGFRTEFSRTTWDEQPSEFERYHRHNNRYEKDLADAKSRMLHFRNLGLPIMACEIEKSVEVLTKLCDEGKYLGFNKITMTSAAMILAKLLGYQYEPNLANPDELAVVDRSTGARRLYCPIAYTLQEAIDYASPEIVDLVNLLEEFPEMGGKPIFDHYRVLVPSFDFSIGTRLSSTAGSDGFPIFHVKQEKNPDFTMIKDGETVGILLGEKEGLLYFLSYWM